MTKFYIMALGITSALFLNGCSKILEPVSLSDGKQNITTSVEQEEFDINIKTLTFETAKKANKAPYLRQLILNGSGTKANVFDEAYFLKSNFPPSSSSSDYLIGIGDTISFKILNEFKAVIAEWPIVSKKTEYLLGAGDELAFAQSNDNSQDISIDYGQSGQILPPNNSDTMITTNGVIGSNGNILLFGLGNINAANRTLDNIRTEVRNILIRKGLAPNFQLEISKFRSKKAFVTNNLDVGETIFLNNLPISLKEVALKAGISKSHLNFSQIKLTRNEKEYRVTASQLFAPSAPEIIIQDNDQIDFQIIKIKSNAIQTTVGPKGYILIPNVGSIFALNRTIGDIHQELSDFYIKSGAKPDFQLEITGFTSQKAYLIQKNVSNNVIPLTSSRTTLRQLLLENNNAIAPKNGLSIITLKRNGQVFQMLRDQVLDPKTPDIWVKDEDQIEVEYLTYKSGKIFALGGAGNAEMIPIHPSKRETLADILFSKNGALNNLQAKRSEIYLLRGQNPSVAYYLDAQNVSRILVAAKTELRPNDIVYVADRPIISFSRTLAEIVPLRILLKDIQDNNIP